MRIEQRWQRPTRSPALRCFKGSRRCLFVQRRHFTTWFRDFSHLLCLRYYATKRTGFRHRPRLSKVALYSISSQPTSFFLIRSTGNKIPFLNQTKSKVKFAKYDLCRADATESSNVSISRRCNKVACHPTLQQNLAPIDGSHLNKGRNILAFSGMFGPWLPSFKQ